MEQTDRYWSNVVLSLGDQIPAYRQNSELRSDSAILRQRTLVIAEFMRLKRQESEGVKPTASLEGTRLRREVTLVDNAWKCSNQAVRQLSNLSRRGPQQRFFLGSYDPKQHGAANRFGVPVKCNPEKVLRIQTDDLTKRKQQGKTGSGGVTSPVTSKTEGDAISEDRHTLVQGEISTEETGVTCRHAAEGDASYQSEAELDAANESEAADEIWCSECRGLCKKTKSKLSVS